MSNERIDSRDIISDYIFYSKYSRVKPDGKKETWPESVSRVMEMHHEFFNGKIKEENMQGESGWHPLKVMKHRMRAAI